MLNDIIKDAISASQEENAIETVDNQLTAEAEQLIQETEAAVEAKFELEAVLEASDSFEAIRTELEAKTASLDARLADEAEVTTFEVSAITQHLDSLLSDFGGLEIQMDSLESMSSEDLRGVLVASNEGLKENIQKAAKAVVVFVKKILDSIIKFVTGLFSSSKRLATKAEALKKQASEFKGEQPKEIKVGGFKSSLHLSGKLPSADEITKCLADVDSLFVTGKSGVKARFKAVSDFADSYSKVVASLSDADKFKEQAESMVSSAMTEVEAAMSGYDGEEAKDSSVTITNAKVMRHKKEMLGGKGAFYGVYEGKEDDLAAKAKFIADGIKVRISAFDEKVKVEVKKDEMAAPLSTSDVVKVCDQVIKTVKAAASVEKEFKEISKLQKSLEKSAASAAKDVKEGEKYVISPMALVSLPQATAASIASLSKVVAECSKASNAALNYASASLKTEKPKKEEEKKDK